MGQKMTNYFIFRDMRLKGNLPFTASVAISSQLDGATPLSTAFSRLALNARTSGKIKTLFILCHGLGDGPSLNDLWWYGGQGLQLGQEGLNSANVGNWAAIKDMVENIVVYACGAAYSGQAAISDPNKTSDGRGLMSSLAKQTNAIVYAADRIQYYYPDDFNFGKWEGTVSAFFPVGLIVSGVRPPTEVIDVISPIEAQIGWPGFGGHYVEILRNARRNR